MSHPTARPVTASSHNSWSSISDTVSGGSPERKVAFEDEEESHVVEDSSSESEVEDGVASRCHIFVEAPGDCVELIDDDNATSNDYFLRVTLFDSGEDSRARKVVIRNGDTSEEGCGPSAECLSFSESATIELVRAESPEDIIGRTTIGFEDLSEIQSCSSTNLIVRELYHPTSWRKVGTIDLRFVVIAQLSEYYHEALGGPLSNARQTKDVMIIGHRGIGSDEQGSRIRENTLLAFNQAAKYGANAVEFDVFLTSDKQPMVYHDLQITASYGQSVTLPITALSKEGLTTMDETSRSRKDRRHHQARSRRSVAPVALSKNSRRATSFVTYNRCESSLGLLRGNSSSEVEQRSSVINMHDGLPTLRCVLEGTPNSLGALVEIKYPTPETVRRFPSRSCHSRNTVVDVILQDVVNFGMSQERMFMFSSFDPELCVTLRRKQARFPVIFNVWFGYEDEHDNTEVDFTDVRNANPYAAIDFCVATELTGICGEVNWIMNNKEWAKECKRKDLLLYTYGEENSTVEGVDTQIRRLGVDGCIVDNINRFKSVKDSPEVEEEALLTLAKARKRWALTRRQSMACFAALHADDDN
ncbi:hypothetical protein FOZ60_001371 [Perkinsus olseni]|uniref:GP-PDE domain-containing protein n=2 Tax=Perkinsus olseni TaxID=32597 RepID=A0A7J6PKG6_PEROL|nr:hypothetical protein FOZ60_001371 [Perkinsus olseni]